SATTWIGIEWSLNLNKRPAHIRQLKNALQILEAEILYSQLSLKNVFEIIAKQIPQPTKSFFEDLCHGMDEQNTDLLQLWDENVIKLIKLSSLGSNEEEILKQFGRTL